VTIDPTPDLPDDALISDLNLPTRIRNALELNGLTTAGEVRETSDRNLLSFQDIGSVSLKFLRSVLGGIQPRD
jgi:DNA-directed RNA polymerase alpha subunit